MYNHQQNPKGCYVKRPFFHKDDVARSLLLDVQWVYFHKSPKTDEDKAQE